MQEIGKTLIFLGVIGKLPGDILIQRKNFSFYFPLVTSLYIRGQKPRHSWRGWVSGHSVFRSKKPRALARGASLASLILSLLFWLWSRR